MEDKQIEVPADWTAEEIDKANGLLNTAMVEAGDHGRCSVQPDRSVRHGGSHAVGDCHAIPTTAAAIMSLRAQEPVPSFQRELDRRERVLIVAMVEPGKPDPLTVLYRMKTALEGVDGVSEVEVSKVGNVPMRPKGFGEELEHLLNRFSQENGSNTPDFILASLVRQTLDTWDLHTRERDRWWGNRSVLGVANDHPAVPTSEQSLLVPSTFSLL